MGTRACLQVTAIRSGTIIVDYLVRQADLAPAGGADEVANRAAAIPAGETIAGLPVEGSAARAVGAV